MLNVPHDLAPYYTSQYYSDINDFEMESYARNQFALIPGDGRIIEIGPAGGALLRLARDRFDERAAVERDPGCCAALRADEVQTIQTADPVAGVMELAPADAVVMFHLIEHVPNPMELLDAAASRVKPGGVLVVATPNPQAFSFRICGARWAHVEAPRHLFLLPFQVVADRVHRCGLHTSMVTSRDPNGLYLDANAWGGWARHVAINARVAYYLRVAVEHLARPIERRRLLGSTYTAVFQRSG